jgi:glycosyltransferase involved in cell wall biosynthesis
MVNKTSPITVVVPVLNEAANISKCLESVQFCERILVVDSGSTDATCKLAEEKHAQVVQFSYDGCYPKKRQWVLNNLEITTPWVLLLDADEQVPPALRQEIEGAISEQDSPGAFLITKGFHFMGQKFRHGGFSHSAVLLFKTGMARFERIDLEETSGLDMEVHERLLVDCPVSKLNTPLIHDDFKGLHAYLDRHNRYSCWEAAIRMRLLEDQGGQNDERIKPSLFGNVQQQRRFLKKLAVRIPGEPWLWFFYHYIARLGFLEGRRGFIASNIRAQYISNVRDKIFERRLHHNSQKQSS